MHSRGIITDAQFAAADKFSRIAQGAELGGARGIDYSRTRVDGGQIGTPLNEHVMNAQKDLASAKAILGDRERRVVSAIAGDCLSIREYATVSGHTGGASRAALVGLLRSGLDALALAWGYATRRAA